MPTSSVKKLSKLASPKPFSQEELSKHIDAILLKELGKIQIDGFKQTHLTIVFWDISGFSTLVKELNDFPDAIIFFLKKYFETAIRIVRKHQGVLDKFIGDGVLAYFGYNSEKKNGNPFDAVQAAIEFRNKFPKLKKEMVRYCIRSNGKDASQIELKCAMHNGIAFIHYFNSINRNSINLIGSTVNLASRFEDLANNGEIIVSQEIKNMIEGKYDLREIKTKDRLNDKRHGGTIKSFPEHKIVYNVLRRLGHDPLGMSQ
jgi:adenylate cyclase